MQQKDFIHANPLASLLIVVLGNFIPLYGVLFWDWALFDIFYIYWVENVLIGASVVIRMLMVSAAWGWVVMMGSLFFVGFFIVHYGMFCFVHGLIMFEIFNQGAFLNDNEAGGLLLYMFSKDKEFLVAMAGLFVVVIIKAVHDVFEDRRDARLPKEIMFSPYGRIIVLHVTIIFGGLAAQELGAPIWTLLLLIVLKTAYDVMMVQDIGFFGNQEKEQV